MIKSLVEALFAKLSPFLIEKIVSSWENPQTVKKIKSGNILVEVDKEHAKNLSDHEMKNFPT